MCAVSILGSPLQFCVAIPQRRRCETYLFAGWPVFDGRRRVGSALARGIIEAAKFSVGHHHGKPFQLQVRYACEDILSLRARAHELENHIERRLNSHEVGKLLTTIEGVGTLTAACIIAEAGDPARFRSAAALASYVGVVPRLHQSGKKRYSGKPAIPLGNARLRRALWMPVLVAVRLNPWLRRYYLHLRAAGKRPKVALVACMHKLVVAIYSVAKHRRPFVSREASLPVTVRDSFHRRRLTFRRGLACTTVATSTRLTISCRSLGSVLNPRMQCRQHEQGQRGGDHLFQMTTVTSGRWISETAGVQMAIGRNLKRVHGCL